ncbi:MAG TPA: hypothetical protein DHU56_11635, partial [Marinobacter sp.]|nr:hypothetical protein [Marinobacter sp.]
MGTTIASVQYESTAYRGNRREAESRAVGCQGKLFLKSWTQGSPLEKSSRSGVFPPKVLETWSPEVMIEEDRNKKRFERESAGGGEVYEPAGWINSISIRYATLPRISWALLWMQHGGRIGLLLLGPIFILTFIFGWTQLHDTRSFSEFFREGVLPFILYLFLPLSVCWAVGRYLEKKHPRVVYRIPKGPKWELNRRTGMVTLYYDPDTDERAGQINAQAPFDEWDGYLVTLPDHQGNLWYRLNLVHKTEEWALPLN